MPHFAHSPRCLIPTDASTRQQFCVSLCFSLWVVTHLPAAEPVATEAIQHALQTRMIDADLPWQEVQNFTEDRVLPLPALTTIADWETYIEGRRQAVLQNVVFRGAAAAWRDAPAQVEWLETIEGGPGYRIRKLRYEALPGMWIPALLYEPEQLTGKVPVALNVNGHDGQGKAADYKQLRCINLAKRGILALNVEWMGMGQLRGSGFNHYKANQLDLCGTNGVSTHYLYMTRALDLLLAHPHADPQRVAVAGLSGGGWQTIFISALDPRVTLSNPVAGYSSYLTRVRYTSDLGDSEQTPVDLAMTADYTHLTAMLAPRAALLTFNAKDQCCFASGHAKAPLMAAAQPVYDLYGKSSHLRAHVNEDPGTHNFLLDNRQQLYRMIGDHFFSDAAPGFATEVPFEAELKTAEQLHVDLPENNADFHTLAQQLMKSLPLPEIAELDPADQRLRLREILRYEDETAELVQSQVIKVDGAQVRGLRFKIGSDWSLPATEFTPSQPSGKTLLLLADGGRTSAAERISARLKQGDRVLAVDPFYFGESKITQRDFLYALLVASVGKRPLGIQAAQIAAVGNWAQSEFGDALELEANGPRTSLMAVAAASLHPELFKQARLHQSYDSLKQIIEQDLNVSQAPELFCFGLLESFDLPQLEQLARPCAVLREE